mmetsp:Transcript_41340/g.89596  ORF Transcript_41340/g.89596 Transcript_41340/m.89596 type:complete len:211 (+) Transcript_41340:655-1287(+)
MRGRSNERSQNVSFSGTTPIFFGVEGRWVLHGHIVGPSIGIMIIGEATGLATPGATAAGLPGGMGTRTAWSQAVRECVGIVFFKPVRRTGICDQYRVLSSSGHQSWVQLSALPTADHHQGFIRPGGDPAANGTPQGGHDGVPGAFVLAIAREVQQDLQVMAQAVESREVDAEPATLLPARPGEAAHLLPNVWIKDRHKVQIAGSVCAPVK